MRCKQVTPTQGPAFGRRWGLMILALVASLVLVSGAARASIVAPTEVTGTEGQLITFEITSDDPCQLTFRSISGLPVGNDATVSIDNPVVFSWTPTLDDAGDYQVGILFYNPFFGCIHHPILVVVNIHVLDAGGEPQFGSVSGNVTADCPAAGTPLYGVPVDAVETGTANLLGSTVTDEQGHYSITDLPVGSYTVNIMPPLGYAAVSSSNSVEVLADQDTGSDFALTCLAVTPAARTIGFWKHQFIVAGGGHGQAQIDASTLCSYLDLIEGHFNNNAINQVVIYVPPIPNTCDSKIVEGKMLLDLHGSVDMIDRAKQQLLALLLNAASGKLALFDVASDDGATISQAITYCDNVIDDPAGDYEKAKTIADTINNGGLVPAGMIPLTTSNIAYRHGALLDFAAGPSPSSGPRSFRFAMTRGGDVSLRIFDIRGSLVATVYEGRLEAGPHAMTWNGRGSDGATLRPGVYFARLSAGSETLRAKLIQVPR